jgi:tetratricopeptide (TPR) repeat protein
MGVIETFEAMLTRGQDSAVLRHGLGTAYLNRNDTQRAIAHLAEAVRLDPAYSAAWKLYGKALAASGRYGDAIAALDQGIATATAKGDVQAAKEMQVFRKRALKSLEG